MSEFAFYLIGEIVNENSKKVMEVTSKLILENNFIVLLKMVS